MALPIYASVGETIWYYAFRVIVAFIFFFLVAPIFIIIPLSFSAGEYFTFTKEMLELSPDAFSIKHYIDMVARDGSSGTGHMWWGLFIGLGIGLFFGVLNLIENGRKAIFTLIILVLVFGILGLIVGSLWGVSGEWISPFKRSFQIAIPATILSVSLGTLAAIGLSQSHVPGRRAIMAILISPMIVPLIISALGMYFFYAPLGLWIQEMTGASQTATEFIKVILAHAVLGVPFVIITVTATLVGFDRSLTRAAANMGAGPVRTFFKVQMPLILPGVISGGLFAFVTSFDEVVVIKYIASAEVKTLPWVMFLGLREQVSLTILSVATVLICFSIVLLVTLELLRRRNERLRGLSAS